MLKAIERQSMKHLPEDAVEEILTNLPVKSLLRFKSVSKPWRSLISSKPFTKKHLSKSTNNSTTLVFKAIRPNGASLGHRSLSLNSLLHAPVPNQHTLTTWPHRPFEGLGGLVRTRGSCNGLILFVRTPNPRCPFLWNPSTRKLKAIPPPPSFQEPYFDEMSGNFTYGLGLGYDDSTDDYKVVCIPLFLKPHPVQIYSLRSDSWKSIGDFVKGTPSCVAGMFVNGKMYWEVKEKGVGSGIVSLDLAEEKYEVVACPPSYGYGKWHLHVLGGYLCCICIEEDKRDKNVWVMTKNGEEAESWTKTWLHSKRRPLWLSKNRDLAMAYAGSSVTVYNSGENEGRHNKLDVIIHHGIVYVESLVSPFGDEEERRPSSSSSSSSSYLL